MNDDSRIQIALVDDKLRILREVWMDAKPERKSHWMEKINRALDERLELMEACAGARGQR